MLFVLRLLLVLFLFVTISGCRNGGGNESTIDDATLRALLSEYGVAVDPTAGRELPSIDDPAAQLGMKLFFSKALGGNFDTACVSCHHPILGGGDALSLPIGVDAENPELLGPGRAHPSGLPTVPRNAPTTFNIALWDQTLFHDGRVESLGKTAGVNGDDGAGIRSPDSSYGVADATAASNMSATQARFPVTSVAEMRGAEFVAGGSNEDVRESLALRLAAMDGWPAEFASVFGDSAVTYQRIAHAIGEYERSQVFVESDFFGYAVRGDNSALSPAAKRGAAIFFREPSEGGAGCARCHGGAFFTDEQFHVLAVPQLGEGKGDGENGSDDFGRFRETGVEADRYAFRTPSLLNVAVTAPFGHSGAFETLEDMVRHHLDPAQSIANYAPSSLSQGVQHEHYEENASAALEQLAMLQATGQSLLPTGVFLSDSQLSDLIEFLESLTDPCVESRGCLSAWIPEPEQDVDGHQLIAVDASGAPL